MAAGEGVGEDGFGDLLEASAGGEASGQAGDLDIEGFEFFGQVQGGAVAFEGGVGAEDDFADGRVERSVVGVGVVGKGVIVGKGVRHLISAFDAGDEALDVEVAGEDGVEGRESSHEDVVGALVGVGLFDGDDVGGLLDDEDGVVVACGVGDDAAGVGFGDVAGDAADFEVGSEGLEGIGEGLGLFAGLAEQVEGDAFGGASADAWELFEVLEEAVVGGHGGVIFWILVFGFGGKNGGIMV